MEQIVLWIVYAIIDYRELVKNVARETMALYDFHGGSPSENRRNFEKLTRCSNFLHMIDHSGVSFLFAQCTKSILTKFACSIGSLILIRTPPSWCYSKMLITAPPRIQRPSSDVYTWLSRGIRCYIASSQASYGTVSCLWMPFSWAQWQWVLRVFCILQIWQLRCREDMVLESTERGIVINIAGAHRFLSCGERCGPKSIVVSTFF